MERLLVRYRRMSEAGRGHWYGAFLGDLFVGDLGIFHRDGVGWFQSVATRVGYRGHGVAGTLVFAAGEHVLKSFDLAQLVIVADKGSQASRIYAAVGFEAVERTVGWARTRQPPV